MSDDATPASPAPGGRRAVRKARTHQAILDAAAEVFAERGYGSATLEAVAATANVAIGSVYAHFPGGKQALFLAALEHHLDQGFAGAERAMDAGFPTSTDGTELSGTFAETADSRTRTILDLEGCLYAMRHDDQLSEQLAEHHRRIHHRATGVVTANRTPADTADTAGLEIDDGDLATVAIALTLGLIQQRWMRPGEVGDDLLGRVLTVLHRAATSPETSNQK